MQQVKVVIVVLIAVLLSGCWDKLEMEDKALVLALGIDMDKESYSFTYAIGNELKPAEGEDAPTPSEGKSVMKIPAKSLKNASIMFMKKTPRKPNFEHLKVIIIGEELYKDKEKLEGLLLELEQNYEIARTVIMFTTTGEANKIIGLEENIQGPIGLYLRKIIENNSNETNVEKVTLDDMLSVLGEDKFEFDDLPKIYEEEDKPILQ